MLAMLKICQMTRMRTRKRRRRRRRGRRGCLSSWGGGLRGRRPRPCCAPRPRSSFPPCRPQPQPGPRAAATQLPTSSRAAKARARYRPSRSPPRSPEQALPEGPELGPPRSYQGGTEEVLGPACVSSLRQGSVGSEHRWLPRWPAWLARGVRAGGRWALARTHGLVPRSL